MMRLKPLGAAIAASCLALVSLAPSQAATVNPIYSGSYSLLDLGSIAGIPGPLGGLTTLAGDDDTLLIGGAANTGAGAIYSVGVTRDGGGHITGFSGASTLFSTAPYIDGGLSYGPGGVLFYTGYPTNLLGQIKPGSTTPDKVIGLSALGISSSVGSMMFVPAGQPGAGSLKIVSYNTGDWYDAAFTPDGTGTYDIGPATFITSLGGRNPEGIAYVPTGSALFTVPTVLVAQYISGRIDAYEVDAAGNPIVSTRKDFVTGLAGAEGALIDPVTGDFLFSTFGGGDHVVRVSGGFVPPPTGVPDGGATVFLLGAAMSLAIALRRRTAA